MQYQKAHITCTRTFSAFLDKSFILFIQMYYYNFWPIFFIAAVTEVISKQWY